MEIRNRGIVVAIAPAVVVDGEICFRSFNYASKKDIVPSTQLIHGILVGSGRAIYEAIKIRKQLILLDPHPEAKGMDHDFQSPTFRNRIERHIKDYLEQGSEYK